MNFAVFDAPKPYVSAREAAGIVREVYDLDGVAEPLPGERDQTFKVSTHAETYVLKVGSLEDRADALDGQAGGIEHALRANALLPVPEVIRSISGKLSGRHMGHGVQLTTFVDGMHPPRTHTSPGLRRATGNLAGRLSRALRGYDHPALHREFPWDLGQLRDLAPLVGDVEPGLKSDIEVVFERFERTFLPLIEGLASQALHGDINPDNMVVDPSDPERIVGLFDFGDMTWGPRIFELAVASAYQGLGADPVAAMIQTAASFHMVDPLE
ncbi:MAG: phosphotransferase, partial [Acidimicrobiia bacterium]